MKAEIHRMQVWNSSLFCDQSIEFGHFVWYGGSDGDDDGNVDDGGGDGDVVVVMMVVVMMVRTSKVYICPV
jgi:hypothetical protein